MGRAVVETKRVCWGAVQVDSFYDFGFLKVFDTRFDQSQS